MNSAMFKIFLLGLTMMLGITFTHAQLSPNIERDFMEFSDGNPVPITWSLTNFVYKLRSFWSGDDDGSDQRNKSVDNGEPVHPTTSISSQQLNTPELRHILEEPEDFKPLTLRLKSKPMNIPEDDDDEL